MVSTRNTSPYADFDRLFSPRGIALVGASATPTSLGGQPLRFLTEYGYAGRVYPVNPKYPELKGLPCYPDVASVPDPCDLALIVVGAHHVPGVIDQCGARGLPFAIVLSAGFHEIGARGADSQRALEAALARNDVRIVGPNCIGLLNLDEHIHAGFGGAMSNRNLRAGRLAMVTQSGGYGLGMVTAADQQGVGFNYIVSTGNETDISATELIRYLLEREDTDAVVAYLEGSTDGRGLLDIGRRALALEKPVLMWKVGNSRSGRRAATSHTGRLSAGPELFRRALEQGGYIEIGDTDDVVDLAQFLRYRKRARGNRVAVLTLSGGAGVLVADLCEQNGFEVPETSAATLEKLKPDAPEFGALGNPIDLTPQGYGDNFASYNRVIATVLAAPEFDQAIVRSAPGAIAAVWARGFVEVARASDKPVMLQWGSGSERTQEAFDTVQAAGIPCFLSPRRSMNALGAMYRFGVKADRFKARAGGDAPRLVQAKALELPASGALGEGASKQVLARYGIPVVRSRLFAENEIDTLRDPRLTYPLAVKIESPDIAHKTEAGAIRLNVTDLAGLRSAARVVVAAARAYRPDARIDGVLVQEMASGTEVILGAVDDPYFGPTVMFGLGGVLTELLHDVTHRFAPFDLAVAHDMVNEIKGAALLRGYRGARALDVAALAEVLVRLSLLIADHAARIKEIDVNPLFVRPAGEGVVAADALVVLHGSTTR
ncbi:MAG: acetate--CoA ligase family protein [Burkholderiales bacterium]|nr:acetate--CoA ligase family protein [Burkholderiales bacterium]